MIPDRFLIDPASAFLIISLLRTTPTLKNLPRPASRPTFAAQDSG
jgi:hypothetical protein